MKIDAPDDVLELMDDAYHAHILSGGCDPHCHVCGAKISIGDRFAFKTFVADGEVITPAGLVIGGIRGTACRTCFEADRSLPPEEERRLRERLAQVKAPMTSKERKGQAMKRLGRQPPRKGCFILPDGTVVP